MLSLIHTLHDLRFVRKLYRHLSALGVDVESPDGYEICRRRPFSFYINRTKNNSSYQKDLIGVILSPNTIPARWCQRDLRQALAEEERSDFRIILPLLYKNLVPPAFLQDHQCFNFSRSYYKTLTQMVASLNQVKLSSLVWQKGLYEPKTLDHVQQFFEQAGWEILPASNCHLLGIFKFFHDINERGEIHLSIQRGLKKSDLDKKMVPKEYLEVPSSLN